MRNQQVQMWKQLMSFSPVYGTALLDTQKNWVSCGVECVLQGTHRLSPEVSL